MTKRARSSGFYPPLSSIQSSSRVSGKLNTFVEVYFIKFHDVSHFFLKENKFLFMGNDDLLNFSEIVQKGRSA